MATQDVITIPFDMPRNEWSALSQFVKRVDYGTCVRLASPTTTYNGPWRRRCYVVGCLHVAEAIG
jgi:hypothetical protein